MGLSLSHLMIYWHYTIVSMLVRSDSFICWCVLKLKVRHHIGAVRRERQTLTSFVRNFDEIFFFLPIPFWFSLQRSKFISQIVRIRVRCASVRICVSITVTDFRFGVSIFLPTAIKLTNITGDIKLDHWNATLCYICAVQLKSISAFLPLDLDYMKTY